MAATPERGVIVERARDLVEFARRNGYRLDELVEIIEGVSAPVDVPLEPR